MTKQELAQEMEKLAKVWSDTNQQYHAGRRDAYQAAAVIVRSADLAEPDESAGGEFEDPFEVRVQIATFNAGETAEAVAKITDAIGSLVGRVSDGEMHRAVTRGVEMAMELADIARRDLSALRDVLHEVE